MIDTASPQRDAIEDNPPPVDIGALALAIRPIPSTAVLLLWWAIFALIIVACVRPAPLTLAALWIYVIVLFYMREKKRRAFLRNLAESPCLSRATPVVSAREWPTLTILIPARDEEANLEAAARSLAALSYPNLEIWFINDHSSDRTPAILDAIRRDFPHVRVLHDPPITDGWFGKSNALRQAYLNIDPKRLHDRSWLLFTDADVFFEPGILEQAIAAAERDRLDFLTCMPRLIAKTWAEQLLLPTGWRGIAQGADYHRMNDPDSFPIGIGAFMLVTSSAYREFGGHRALAQWHPEDTLMAAAVKHIGGRVGFAWSPDLLRVRFYQGYREVKKHTLRKTRIFFGEQINLPLTMIPLRLSTTLVALPMAALGILPQLIAGRFDLALTLLGTAGLVLYIEDAREYKGIHHIAEFHPIVPWLHPISGVLRVCFAISLLAQILARRPMEWRGRHDFGGAGTRPDV